MAGAPEADESGQTASHAVSEDTLLSGLELVEHFAPAPTEGLRIAPFLDAIEAQAETADRTRSVSSEVVEAIRGTDFMRMSASRNIGGVEETMLHMGRELEAVAARCPSLAWCLWNHLCVFHLFVGSVGPEQQDFLTHIVTNGQWVSFPGGARSSVYGRVEGDQAILNGTGRWGTGARYADYCGVAFAITGDDGKPVRHPAPHGAAKSSLDIRFTILPTTTEGMKIDPSWDGAGLRASATDDVHYTDVPVNLSDCVAWFGANRAESLRTVPVVHHRYREDWVGISDLWLSFMAVGLVRRALAEAADAAGGRRVIIGGKMVDRPTVQVNFGRAASLLAAAAAATEAACNEVDRRIAAGVVPDEADYLRQMAVTTMAVEQLDEAMSLLHRTQGGTALREGGAFDRRYRDFRAMPVHINVHQDRVTHQLGRHLLGLELNPF
ncbi:acyl-CoA dehydrogenase family protein [Candidatus Poriferisodalis sp.]|uniref:acyl-CoA dehydrogenase family protein n=1 Tax=Candidatus Poriferisodalis sp. TaxID=3101277 RepID=UPI003B01A883